MGEFRVEDEVHSIQVHRQECDSAASAFTYTEAEVEQEKHVESHVDLQCEVFVEVLTGLDRTIRDRNTVC